MPTPPPEPESDTDAVIEKIGEVSQEAAANYRLWKKRTRAGEAVDLAGVLDELYGMFVDFAEASSTAHAEHFQDLAEHGEAIEDLEGAEGSVLFETDALRLKNLIMLLASKIAPSEITADLSQQINEAVSFIDEITAKEEPDDEETSPQADDAAED
jgi:hypothetical protein